LTDDISQSINRSADGMIRLHGPNAVAQAHLSLQRMRAMKDGVGERMWQAIAIAIEKKQRPLGG